LHFTVAVEKKTPARKKNHYPPTASPRSSSGGRIRHRRRRLPAFMLLASGIRAAVGTILCKLS